MSLRSSFDRSHKRRKVRQPNRGHVGRRLRFETFEDRCLLSLTPAANYSVGMDMNPEAIVAADFNDDGHLDLATANTGSDSVSVLLGNANGTFQAAKTFAAGANPISIAVGDFNDDGALDLAVADGFARGVNVMFGNRDGTFQAPAQILVGSTEYGERVRGSLAAGDFNGDGKMDLVVISNYRVPGLYPQGVADVLLAVGDGSFSTRIPYVHGARCAGAHFASD